jgi:hypothetical protein
MSDAAVAAGGSGARGAMKWEKLSVAGGGEAAGSAGSDRPSGRVGRVGRALATAPISSSPSASARTKAKSAIGELSGRPIGAEAAAIAAATPLGVTSTVRPIRDGVAVAAAAAAAAAALELAFVCAFISELFDG